MSVHDYLIDHRDFDWAHLLLGWEWLLLPDGLLPIFWST
jgi:hypothetical protein